MSKFVFALAGLLVLEASVPAQSTNPATATSGAALEAVRAPGAEAFPLAQVPVSADPQEQMLIERKHFLECLSYVYSPALWISYGGSLYFAPKDLTQLQQLTAMKNARAGYTMLTSPELRHTLAAKGIAASGIDEAWKKMLLLPVSGTNQNLTPTLNRPLRTVLRFKLLKRFGHGDAVLSDGQSAAFVMDFGRGAADLSGTNACLIREGEKTLTSASGETMRFEAFTSVTLSREEFGILSRVAATFRRQAADVDQELAGLKDQEDFENCKARATDSNPYMQYLLAVDYLQGKGTDKDESAGMEWMNRAAHSGSGDAQAYLNRLSPKPKPSP